MASMAPGTEPRACFLEGGARPREVPAAAVVRIEIAP